MTKKQNSFGSPMGPNEGDGTPDSAEDKALWQLMGVLDDVAPTSTFAKRVQDQAVTRTSYRQPWYRRGWVPAAAAVLMLAITIPFALDDKNAGNPEVGEIQSAADYQGVVELLDGMSDTDLMALDANETESVQADWFGG